MSLQTRELQFGDLVVDPVARLVRRDEDVLPLTGKAFDLLLYMVENPNRPLFKKELLDAVWPGSFVEEANLSQNVFLIRKALGEAGPRTVRTLSGRGYQFTARVTPVVAEAEEVRTPEPPGDPAPAQALAATETRVVYEEETEERIGFWRSPLTISLAAAAILALAVASWLGWKRWQDRVGGPPVQVVLADPEGSTGDPVLDRTLTSILRMELAQSPFVSVVSAPTVRRTMLQMMHKPDDPLTAQLAVDLCERTASQAVLRGSVARVGQGYILTEEATNCVDGAVLGTANQRVSRNEDLPAAVKKLSATLRHELGESRRTISRFNKPLLPAATNSIEALKDYSHASELAQLGRFPEAIELLKQAVAIDPQFASAYLDLSTFSYNALDPANGQQYLQKAYEFRDQSTEPVRLLIDARYQTEVTGDLYASLRAYQAWVNLYPRNAQAWSGMAAVDRMLGQYKEELVAAQHTKELAPNNAVVYQAEAQSQMATGDYAGARATCQLALARGYDGESTRHLLLQLGHLTHDEALVRAQESWAEEHPDSPVLFAGEAVYAQGEGRTKDAEKLFEEMSAAFLRRGVPEAAARIRQGESVAYFELGEEDLGRKWLHSTPADGTEFNTLLALMEAGETATATKLLEHQLASHPQSTLWKLRYAPLLRGEAAMISGRPGEAITLMEQSRPLDGQGADGFYLRGKALMQAKRFSEAEAEFRSLLEHPGIEPTAYQLPMAQLQLARVLSHENRYADALKAYRHLLQVWKDADSSFALLTQAKRELAALQLQEEQRKS